MMAVVCLKGFVVGTESNNRLHAHTKTHTQHKTCRHILYPAHTHDTVHTKHNMPRIHTNSAEFQDLGRQDNELTSGPC